MITATTTIASALLMLAAASAEAAAAQPATGPATNDSGRLELAHLRLTEGFWQVWICDADGRDARQVTADRTDKRSPRWSMDGKAIFFSTANHEPFRLDLETRKAERILGDIGFVNEVVPTSQPSRIVYTRFRSTLRDRSEIWVADTNGNGATLLTDQPGLQYNPAISPDGRRLAYVVAQGYRTQDLFMRDISGRNPRRLTNNRVRDFAPAWSPDGRTLAYVCDDGNDYEIWLLNTDGGDPKRLTRSEGIDGDPSWSPDGRRIAFTSSRSGDLQIWVMNADGTDPRQITRGSPCRDPSWRRNKP